MRKENSWQSNTEYGNTMMNIVMGPVVTYKLTYRYTFSFRIDLAAATELSCPSWNHKWMARFEEKNLPLLHTCWSILRHTFHVVQGMRKRWLLKTSINMPACPSYPHTSFIRVVRYSEYIRMRGFWMLVERWLKFAKPLADLDMTLACDFPLVLED